MPVTVTTPAVDNDLVRLEDVKLALNINGVDKDLMLSGIISRASDDIRTRAGRVFARETVTEKLGSSGSSNMVLDRTPIISISEVRDNGAVIPATDYEILNPDSGIVLRPTGWRSTALWIQNIEQHLTRFQRLDWEFDYIGGYAMPNTEDPAPKLPGDLVQACIELVKTWYLRAGEDGRVQSQRTGDSSETLFAGTDLPPLVQQAVSRYQRVYV